MRLVDHFQLSSFIHFRIFDDLFGANVFVYNTQNLKVKWGDVCLYQGNLIEAAVTSKL